MFSKFLLLLWKLVFELIRTICVDLKSRDVTVGHNVNDWICVVFWSRHSSLCSYCFSWAKHLDNVFRKLCCKKNNNIYISVRSSLGRWGEHGLCVWLENKILLFSSTSWNLIFNQQVIDRIDILSIQKENRNRSIGRFALQPLCDS